MTTHNRIEGWKAIADYLGVDVKTARRRERMGGIRVVREYPWPGAKKAFVVATAEMLRPAGSPLQ